jgi:hypothetical protein
MTLDIDLTTDDASSDSSTETLTGKTSATNSLRSTGSSHSISSAALKRKRQSPQKQAKRRYCNRRGTFAELQEYFDTVKKTDLYKSDEPVEKPPEPKRRYSRRKKLKDEGPYLGHDLLDHQIGQVLSYSTFSERLLFQVKFTAIEYPQWVDFVVVIELQPRHVWVDYLRGLYLYYLDHRYYLRKTAYACNLLKQLEFFLGRDLIIVANKTAKLHFDLTNSFRALRGMQLKKSAQTDDSDQAEDDSEEET